MKKLLAILPFVLPSEVSAHPDHSAGVPGEFLHYLTDPFHLSIAATGLIIVVVLVLGVRRSARSH